MNARVHDDIILWEGRVEGGGESGREWIMGLWVSGDQILHVHYR